MRRLLISGLAMGLAGLLAPAAMAGDSATVRPLSTPAKMPERSRVIDHGVHHGDAAARWRDRNRPSGTGGWTNYRRAPVGYILPRYWLQPTYFIPNYRTYGLPVPQSGYGWSRYYDDAVLTDRYGRVYDSRSDVRWNADDRRQLPYELDGYGDTGLTYNGGLSGRWVGTWYGDDGRVYSGEYRGSYDGGNAPAPVPGGRWKQSERGAGYDAPKHDGKHHRHPHWSDEAMAPYPYDPSYSSTYDAYGYGAPVIVTTTVYSKPVVTTTSYIEEKTVYTRKPVRRVHKARSRLRPVCSCGS